MNPAGSAVFTRNDSRQAPAKASESERVMFAKTLTLVKSWTKRLVSLTKKYASCLLALQVLKQKSVIVNRAPMMTAWATVVAECMGFQREEALSIGQKVFFITPRSSCLASISLH